MSPLHLAPMAGVAAQLVDGVLGMGSWAIGSGFLLGLGMAPVLVAAAVNLAALGSGLVGAAAHHRFGNVHWPTAARLGVPGALGAFAGAWAVVSLAGLEAATPVTSAVLVVLGAVIVWRFARGTPRPGRAVGALTVPAGLAGGFLASVGGGWGAVATPVVLAASRQAPRRVVGSVAAARAAVAGAAVLGFWWALPSSLTVLWPLAAGLAAGGALAAVPAAWLARRLPPQMLGAAIGAAVMALHLRTLLGSVTVDWPVAALAYAVPALALAAVLARRYAGRAARAVAGEPEPAEA